MRTGRPTSPIILTTAEREQLEAICRRTKAPQNEAARARVILNLADGMNNKQACAKAGLCAQTVGTLRRRFNQLRLEGLFDLPRSGAPRSISDQKVAEVVRLTLETKPKHATHWSTRSMAKRCGLSNESIYRIWKTFGLQPHRSETFQLSTDPQFVEKVRDVVGLYVSPPQNALVLCLDEKSQIQALERSQPIFPLSVNQPERRTSDYFRHGTTSLFAALDVASGAVYARCQQRHRQREFLAFLRQLEALTPKESEIHAVLDNYAAHKTAKVRLWIAKHPRWHLHFIPTHSSWLNQVERFFAKITEQRIRRESFRSVAHLKEAILDYIEHHNKTPKPFKWTASAELILTKVENFCKSIG
jgi:transposase